MSKQFRVILITFIALLSSSCSQPPPLRIGTNQWPGYEPLYLARDMGFFSTNQIKMVELPSSTDSMQLLRNGTLEGAALTLDETLTLLSEGVALKVIAVMNISAGADSLLVRPDIGSLADLEGQRIGVELSGLGATMLAAVLHKASLTSRQIKVVPLTVDQHLSAFKSGRIDAVISFEPTRSKLLELGARERFTSREIPGRIIDVLVVREAIQKRHQQQIHTLVSGYFKARDMMRTQPVEAATRMAPRLRMSSEELLRSFQLLELPDRAGNRAWLSTASKQANTSSKLDNQADSLAALMFEAGLIPSYSRSSPLADAQYLPGE